MRIAYAIAVNASPGSQSPVELYIIILALFSNESSGRFMAYSSAW